MTMAIVVIVVTSALLAGAAWGLFGPLPKRVFLIATSGGALIVSVVSELVEPASENAPLLWVMAALMLGAVVFLVLDYFVKQKFGGGGGGLLAAITLDGIPENLALGVALIGASPLQVASLAGSIFLSNLPEAARRKCARTACQNQRRSASGPQLPPCWPRQPLSAISCFKVRRRKRWPSSALSQRARWSPRSAPKYSRKPTEKITCSPVSRPQSVLSSPTA